ncbi:pentatricopeptide repeat-containing protein [Prunus yedoensis var. nudiflora]|uniref:Pentatricopeptide repeat-containing protein n=1 Tax=Prunus yedoensis var. nudiflora TaxID=2094558 RepID=A0A314Y3K8_PRUYE|nr:pentatricopeptide repeat-containing protein [Prunus yedoensis var. nudiflora]
MASCRILSSLTASLSCTLNVVISVMQTGCLIKWPHRDVYSWNAILGGYCKFGSLGDAQELFLKFPERNTVSWNTLISALVRHGQEETALGVYDTMILEGFMPTRFTLASVFSACGALLDVEHARRCHGLAIKIGLEENIYVGNAILSMYAKCGLIRDAIRVFGDMAEPNEVTFTAIMGGLGQTDRVMEALEMFRMMCRKGVHIDSVSLSSLLGVCAKGGGGGECGLDDQSDGFPCNVNGQQIHGLTIKLGFEGDLHLNNSLLDMYAKNRDMNSAEKFFANLPKVSNVSWNIMIAGYGQICETQKALEYLQRMRSCCFEPDESGTTRRQSSFSGKCSFNMCNLIEPPWQLPSAPVQQWGFCRLEKKYMLPHKRLPFKQTCLSLNSQDKEAFTFFKQMRHDEMRPTQFTYATVLSCCAKLSSSFQGKQNKVKTLLLCFFTWYSPYGSLGTIKRRLLQKVFISQAYYLCKCLLLLEQMAFGFIIESTCYILQLTIVTSSPYRTSESQSQTRFGDAPS